MDWRCERWAIIDKNGKEIDTLGWYKRNTSKEEVIRHAKIDLLMTCNEEKGEDVKIVEEY